MGTTDMIRHDMIMWPFPRKVKKKTEIREPFSGVHLKDETCKQQTSTLYKSEIHHGSSCVAPSVPKPSCGGLFKPLGDVMMMDILKHFNDTWETHSVASHYYLSTSLLSVADLQQPSSRLLKAFVKARCALESLSLWGSIETLAFCFNLRGIKFCFSSFWRAEALYVRLNRVVHLNKNLIFCWSFKPSAETHFHATWQHISLIIHLLHLTLRLK